MWSVWSFISIIFLNPGSHPFGIFMPFSTMAHGFIVALKLLVPKKRRRSPFSLLKTKYVGLQVAGCERRYRSKSSPTRETPTVPHRGHTGPNARWWTFWGRRECSWGSGILILREWAQVGIILLLALPAFSINFVCPFFHFWTWKLGNSNHFPSSSSSNLQGFFFATASREPLLFAS